MPHAGRSYSGQRGHSSLNVVVVVAGLAGGVLLGALLLRDGASAGGAAQATQRSPSGPSSELSSAEPAAPIADEAEVELLKRRIAALEKAQLRRRLADLEKAQARESTDGDDDDLSAVEEAAGRRFDINESRPGTGQRGERRERSFDPVREVPAAAAPSQAVESVVQGHATLAYWNALNDIIARDAGMRTAPGKVTAENAGGFVEGRVRAGKFAATAIRALYASGVDSEAIALGQELAAWYDEEAALGGRAGSLLASSDIAARTGAAGHAWRASEDEHRRKCDAVNRRAAELRTRLSKKYDLAFPALN
ncbi:MAG: hypothetical protein ACT4QC_02280 [Planctomycetaceae bacterium]